MTLSLEQFKALRQKGLTTEQIVKFDTQPTPSNDSSILKQGVEGAKEAARGFLGQGVSQFVPGLESKPLQSALDAGENISEGMTKNLPQNPNLQTPLGGINPRSVSKFGVQSFLDPRSLAGMITGVGSVFRPRNAGKLVRGLADVPSKSVKALREIGPENVFNPKLESEQFIGKDLTPKVSSLIRKSMGIPEEEIIALEGKYKGSPAPILDRVKGSLTEKVTSEEGRITKILEEAPLSKRIRLNEFRSKLTDSLTGLFKGGKLRKDIPKEDLKPIRELIDMYKDKRQVFDKTEFLRRRSRLIDLQKSPSGEVASKATMLKDALDMDAEQFGIEGLREAKGAYKTAKEMEGRFLNRNTGDFKFGESRLSKVGDNLPSQDMDALKELESYIGQPFIEELSKVNKIRNISEEFSGTKVESLLKSAQKPENVQIREQLKTILGESYPEIEKLLTSNRVAQEFSPKGFYASRGGIIKGAARAGLKSYEESVRPTLSKLAFRKKK